MPTHPKGPIGLYASAVGAQVFREGMIRSVPEVPIFDGQFQGNTNLSSSVDVHNPTDVL